MLSYLVIKCTCVWATSLYFRRNKDFMVFQNSFTVCQYSRHLFKETIETGSQKWSCIRWFFSVAINDYLHVEPGISFSIKGSRVKPDYTTVITTDEQSVSIHEKVC
ncbi:MAG: hypothetical protein IPP34_17925 [Bacteroidetes bacterium]|nr:hypothetical protein [Bacteroidota bacterium]